MQEFAYRGSDPQGQFYAGPVLAADPESVVRLARQKGHLLMQVYVRQTPSRIFLGLLDLPALSLPATVPCRKWRFLSRRSSGTSFGSARHRGLLDLVRRGELQAERTRFPPRLDVSTSSLMARARRGAEARLEAAIRSGLARDPAPEEDPKMTAMEAFAELDWLGDLMDKLDPEQAPIIERAKSRLESAGVDPAEVVADVMIELTNPDPRCDLESAPPDPGVIVRTREGMEFRIETPESMEHDNARGLDFLLGGGDPEPPGDYVMTRLAFLCFEEVARRGYTGLEMRDQRPGSAARERLHLRMFSGDKTASLPGPPRCVFGLMRDIVVAMAGMSPTVVPPAALERRFDLNGTPHIVQSEIGLTSAGEFVRVEWRRC